LPEFLDNPNIEIKRQNDTLIKGEKNYMFIISLKDMFITGEAKLWEKKGYIENYELYISRKNFLPTQLTNIFPENKGFSKSEFSNYDFSEERPDSVWDYQRFTNKYLVLSNLEFRESMMSSATVRIGQNAPDWFLPVLNGDSLTLSDLKRNLVLLEFWFPYCGGCVKVIPDLNEIQKTYSNQGLKILSIEFSQSNNKGLVEYGSKQNIEYQVLYTGKEIAKMYGILAAPTFFLIDRKGKIVYTSVGFNKDGLIKSIEENI
jgi:thiol-disulfide isomerase/thioredoxin